MGSEKIFGNIRKQYRRPPFLGVECCACGRQYLLASNDIDAEIKRQGLTYVKSGAVFHLVCQGCDTSDKS